jgi:ubiquinone/menaquinone biosynthesis C-methylase UbiE
MLQETTDKTTAACRPDAGWRSQFGHPRGWLGRLAGHLMTIRNKKRSLWVLSLLDLRPTDRVLEVGFGSGADIRRAAGRVPAGFVAGIDHSEVMVRQASRRNAAAIRSGRVELRQGSASRLPYASNSFDTVFAINVAQFWDTEEPVREIHRVLKTGGRAAFAVQPRSKGATEETAHKTGQSLAEAMTAAGFEKVKINRLPLKPVSTVCVVGIK